MGSVLKRGNVTEIVPCSLEIDHARGVIYVHAATKELIDKIGQQTLIRIQGLPTPIPAPSDGLLDINYNEGENYYGKCSWEED